ncbi:MAG: GntR family transcriptional regulator [Candidatus Cloacimonadales bacterium]
MIILISNSSELPIYQQIAEQIKEQIMSKNLTEGDLLPSIRSLARELKISVITTKKAYSELEKERFVESVPGKGTFVAKANLEYLTEMRLKKIEENLLSALDDAKTINLKREELIKMLITLDEEL